MTNSYYRKPADFALEVAAITAIIGRAPDLIGYNEPYWIWHHPESADLKDCLRVDYWEKNTVWPDDARWTLARGAPMTNMLAKPGFDDVVEALTTNDDLRNTYAKKPI